MSDPGHLVCRSCQGKLFTFNQLAIHHQENKVIVHPKFFSSMNETIRRRANEDTQGGNCPSLIYCRQCDAAVGTCLADAIVTTAFDLIKAKSVAVVFPDGTQCEVSKWPELLNQLEEKGVERIRQRELIKQANGRIYSRDGLTTYRTVLIDVQQTSDSTFEKLTKTPMRNYQIEMVQYALGGNSLVCLPTGSGKTLVAAAVVRAMLHVNPMKVALFVVPTNHLVEQQSHQLEAEIASARIVTLFGQMDPDLRRTNIKTIGKFNFDILVGTCECMNRLLEINSLRVEDLCCLVLDEAHGTKGDSPYAKLSQRVNEGCSDESTRPLVLGMTASPLETIKKDTSKAAIAEDIQRLASQLCCQPCYPRKNDPYANGIKHTKDFAPPVENSELERKFKGELDTYLREVVSIVKDKLMVVAPKFKSLQELVVELVDAEFLDTNNFRGKLRKIEDQLDEARDTDIMKNNQKTVYYGYAVRDHLNQILAVHEINSVIGHEVAMHRLKSIFDDIEDSPPGQERRKKEILYRFRTDFSGQPVYAQLHQKLKSASNGEVFAKHLLSKRCQKVLKLITEHYTEYKHAARILVFVDMRRTARKLCQCFSRDPGIRTGLNPQVIVGKGLCGDGRTVEEQQEILKDFRDGRTRLLISTTVLEEGLDVPSCNMVLRMAAPDNLKQFVQSRGRASRSEDGKFYIICKNKEESDRQQYYLTCMEKQAEIIKQMMVSGQGRLGELTRCQTRELDLDADSGRAEREAEVPDQVLADDDIDDEALQEMIKIMGQEDTGPEQADVRFLEEHEPEEVAIPVRFVVFAQDKDTYHDTVDQIKTLLGHLFPEIDLVNWADITSPVKGKLGTTYFPQTVLTLRESKGQEDAQLFEKKVLELFMSKFFDVYELKFWMYVHNPRSYFPRSTGLRLSLHRTSIGSLMTAKEYVNRLSLGMASHLRVDQGGEKITITVNDRFQIIGSFADLQNFALVDRVEQTSTQEPLLHLYLTFVQPPRFSEVLHGGTSNGLDTNRVIEYNGPDSRLILGSCLTYKLEIPNPVTHTSRCAIDRRVHQVLRLLESSGITMYYTRVQHIDAFVKLPTEDEGIDPRLCPVHYRSKDVNYAMRCLYSSPGFVPERLDDAFYEVLNSIPTEKNAARALYGLTRAIDRNLFCDLAAQLKEEIGNLRHVPDEQTISESHAYIKRVVLTPTSVRFYEPEYVQTNRTVRRYGAPFFVTVNVRDENYDNLTSLYGKLPNIINRVRDVLTYGLRIGDIRYDYLASSNSQMRAHSCYFVEDDGNRIADVIRREMGDLSEITNVASYVSRMGLGFSTSKQTITVNSYFKEMDTEHDGYVFSDGVGMIPKSLAMKVQEKLRLNTLPSAFQIRIGGCKGVVSVWDDNLFKAQCDTVQLVVRHSMFKYPSPNKGIEVLEYTRPLPLHLNQQIIMLLSNLGVGDAVFMDLLRTEIVELGKAFIDEECACKVVKNVAKEQCEPLERVRFSFTSDPYFRQLMMAVYKQRMKDMKERSRVRLDDDKGRVLIGILDETGILQYGDVFIQISKHLGQPGIDKRVITSKIVIMKNPCLHPGDARTFQGRDVPQLRDCVDCVIFPKNGPRPHPNELSGSDLDGDQYHCIWDTRLLPSLPLFEPMDYKGGKREEESEPIGVTDMVRHTCEYIGHDTLGMIDNTHKALADQRGIESDICLQLAVIHSMAVDAPKTADWQDVPTTIKSELRVYPDFMMKSDKPSYSSSTVLGQMFRECTKYMTDTSTPSETRGVVGLRPDQALWVDGYKNYVDDAFALFKTYNSELLVIMTMYGIRTEAELMSGAISTVHSRLVSELQDIQDTVRNLIKKIRERYRGFFFNDESLGRDDRDANERKKATAWYYVAYDSKYGDTYAIDRETHHFLSFPWLVSDILAKIFYDNTTRKAVPFRSLFSEISDSVKEIFDSAAEKMTKIYKEHEGLQQLIGRQMQRFAHCFLFGFSSLMLFDECFGDVSILVVKQRGHRPELSAVDQVKLLKKVRSEGASLFAASNLDEEANCPKRLMVKINRKRPKRTACLTADINAALQWTAIKKYMFKHKRMFPVLRLLCSWMVSAGLIGGKIYFLPDYLVPLLFIDHCLKERKFAAVNPDPVLKEAQEFCQDPVKSSPFGNDEEWESMVRSLKDESWRGQDTAIFGDLLYSFMKDGKNILRSEIHPGLRYVLNATNWSEVEKPERLSLLESEMEKASHRLSLHVNASVLLIRIPVERLFFIKFAAAKDLTGDEDGLTRMLHQKSGAWIDVQNKMNAKAPGMIVKGNGTEAELYLLDKLVQFLNRKADAEKDSKRVVRVRGLKDVTGAHNLLVEGSSTENGSIRLEPYMGFKYPQHDHKRLYVIRLNARSVVPASDPRNTDIYDQFRKHFKHQMKYFIRNYSKELYGEAELQVKFGRSYVVSPPASFVEDQSHLTAEELLRALERQKLRVVDPMFGSDFYRRRTDRAARPQAESFVSTSFVSSVVLNKEDREYLKDLVEKGNGEENSGCKCLDEGVKVVAQTGTGVFTARYDKNLEFVGMETSPIRWVVSDVKRISCLEDDRAEGNECDVRIMLKTQMSENSVSSEDADPALFADFRGAIAKDGDQLYVAKSNLDVDFVESYNVYSYDLKLSTCGIPCSLIIRQSTQYTRRIVNGRFSNTRDMKEVRLVPSLTPFLDNTTLDSALDALWVDAFKMSSDLKCKTQ